MGGEKSKKNGEFGEDKVEKFLEVIGWSNPREGVSISCVVQDEHNKSETVGTHGIDFGFTYNSPLIDGQLVDACVSVKFTGGSYPNSPNPKFKEYIFDLATTMECYKKNEKRKDILKGFKGFDSINDVGILFWLTNNKVVDNTLFSKISTARLDDALKFSVIYVVDDNRFSFIEKSIKFVKGLGKNFDFHYPDTGKNILPMNKKSHGKMLPVEYINSSILPMRIENSTTGETCLLISVIDNFHKDDLKMIIGLSQNLSKSWANKTLICFPDYDKLTHIEEVKSVISQFEDPYIKKNLQVFNYNLDYNEE